LNSRFVAEVIEDPWEGQELPIGAKIPTKPLVGDCGFHISPCSVM